MTLKKYYHEFYQGENFLGNMLYDMNDDKKQNKDVSKVPENAELVNNYRFKLKEMRDFVNKDPFEND